MAASFDLRLLVPIKASEVVDRKSNKKTKSFTEDQFAGLRRQMVTQQLEARGIKNSRVLEAMATVPRHKFVPTRMRHLAYEDGPLSIGYSQTISQPYIVAYMCECLELKESDRVLEIGTGSGYGAAILAKLGSEVVSIERIPELSDAAQSALDEAGIKNVRLVVGDGTEGFALSAPYAGIVVTAAGPRIPEEFKNQLAAGGKLVMPVYGQRLFQNLIRVTRLSEEEFIEEKLCEVRFVPLIREHGWTESKSAR